MPAYDWTRVEPGIFHDFHTAWITELRNILNGGLLPPDFNALAEQHAGRMIPDLLTLNALTPTSPPVPRSEVGLAVAEAPPRVRRKLTVSASARSLRRSLAIRHLSGHRRIALIEILSPANKHRRAHVDEFVNKVVSALEANIHVAVLDILPHGRHDPHGVHGEIWSKLDEEGEKESESQSERDSFTFASYVAGMPIEVYLDQFMLGDSLPDFPLFLWSDRYLSVPAEATYEIAFRGTPRIYGEQLQEIVT